MDIEDLLEQAKTATYETKYIEFKRIYSITETKKCLQLVKEIIAFANTDGGVIIFGVDDYGKHVDALHDKCDLSTLTDKLNRYTSINFDKLIFTEIMRDNIKHTALYVQKNDIPIVFEKDGEYNNKYTNHVFRKGIIYIRKGTKTSSATNIDIYNIVSLIQSIMRDSIFDKISELKYVDVDSYRNIRITDDASAPQYHLDKCDKTHALMYKDIIKHFHDKHGLSISNHNLTAVKKVYKIDDAKYCYKSHLYSSPTYSYSFIEWLEEQYKKDNNFFDIATYKYNNSFTKSHKQHQ